MTEANTATNPLFVPLAIIIAGMVIGGAIYLRNPAAAPLPPQAGREELIKNLRPIAADDHRRGAPDAPVVIVEYSDLECPFCKAFSQTMRQVMERYGATGEVAWVYRHFPLDRIHPKARQEAEATECVAGLGGEEAFWQYHDKIFEITPSNNGLDLALLPSLAEELEIDRDAFTKCLDDDRYAARVAADVENAIASGGEGTPFNMLIGPDGAPIILGGAVPVEQLTALIESLLEKEN